MGCFAIVDVSAGEGQQLYRTRVVDFTMPDNKKRSRLCIAACHDNDHCLFKATVTTSGPSIRLLPASCATDEVNLHTCAVNKPFVLSKTNLRRPVFMHAQK